MTEVLYQQLNFQDIAENFLDGYQRQQCVRRVYRGEHGSKRLVPEQFLDDWDAGDRANIRAALVEAARNGGYAIAARTSHLPLAGFAALAPGRIGPDDEYIELLLLHVDARCRGTGIGRELFDRCAREACFRGAKRLYISSQSSEQTVRFYRAFGCRDATWLSTPHVEEEPADYQLEFRLMD
jgi:ribosomal protein S18 acetylase RimI-like enzyme